MADEKSYLTYLYKPLLSLSVMTGWQEGVKVLTPVQLWGCLSSGRASGGRTAVSAPPARHFAALDMRENMHKGTISEVLRNPGYTCLSRRTWSHGLFSRTVPPFFCSEGKMHFPVRHHNLSRGFGGAAFSPGGVAPSGPHILKSLQLDSMHFP